MNDYGTEIEGLPGPALLNLTESCGKSPFSFEQKGAVPVVHPKTPYITVSHNGLRPSPNVKQEHLDALRGSDGREFMNGIVWTKPMPREMKNTASTTKCPKCAVAFTEWCMEAVSESYYRAAASETFFTTPLYGAGGT